jgi:O-antigen ligase
MNHPAMHDVNRTSRNPRLWLVCLAAVSVSLPMAWISLTKVFVLVGALVFLTNQIWFRRSDNAIARLWTPWTVVLMLACSGCSLVWTAADLPSALVTLVKHSKLLEIALLVSLIRTATEGRTAVTAFACGQVFMLLSSWLMVIGVNVPWHANAPTPYVVFSTYLDQSIMFATAASVFWHLRHEKLWSPAIGAIFTALAIANSLLVLEGRSGYLIALSAVALAFMWAVPHRLRLAAFVIAPVVVLAAVGLGSGQVQERIGKIVTESQNFAKTQKVEVGDSSGWRLNAWYRSVQAITDRPLLGHGVGAWTFAVKRMEGSSATEVFGESNQSNPHQEFLMWGVELGVGGLLLFLFALVCVARDALRFPRPVKRATLAVLVAVAIACLFNSALYDDLIGDFLVITLGLLMSLGTRSAAEREPKNGVVA